LNAKRQASASAAKRKIELAEAFALLPRAQAKLDTTETELKKWDEAIAKGFEQVEAYDGEASCECPSCHVKLKVAGKSVELFTGKTADGKKLAEAQAELAKAREAKGLMDRTKVNDLAAVQNAEQAGRDLEALNATAGEDVTEAMVERVEKALLVQRNTRDSAKAKVEMMAERLDLIAGAHKRGTEAAKHHQDVKDWTLIATALAPDGIPGEILAGALEPINTSLATLSATAGWPKVAISTDMAITANGRLYALLSESERWRCDALIGLTIALASGLNLVLMDRFDVLLPAVRAQLLGMLLNLSKAHGVQASICGSLKEKPTKRPADFQVGWIENGTAGGDVQLQKAG